MRRRALHGFAMVLLLVALFASTARSVSADHESTNSLTFAPVAGSPSPDGSGNGTVDFRGGAEPTSRWTATFKFAGLQADTSYTIAIQGRFGADGSPQASAPAAICRLRTDRTGAGRCWHYYRGMQRLGVAQLRLGGEDGPAVLQATRAAGGPGSIRSVRNRHSPSQ